MKRYLFLLLVLSVVACKKKQVQPGVCLTTYTESTDQDTVQPSPYLMTYPGSEWHYDDGSVETCDAWELKGIVSAFKLPNNCPAVHTTFSTLSHTSFGYVQGTDLLAFPGPEESTTFDPLLDTVEGVFYNSEIYSPGSSDASKHTDIRTAERLDSLLVAGVVYYDVIRIHQARSVYYYHWNSGPSMTRDTYYANGIGLIRVEQTGNGPWQTYTKNLVSYVIGPH